jgi:hypothetical protein
MLRGARYAAELYPQLSEQFLSVRHFLDRTWGWRIIQLRGSWGVHLAN